MRLSGPLGLVGLCTAILALYLHLIGPGFVTPVLAANDTPEATAREFDSPVATPRAQRRAVRSLLEIRREKTVVQEWDLSCGAAALATILTYQHGDPVPEREVAMGLMSREEYVAQPALVRIRHGFSLLDLKRYVDQRGYEGVGYGKLELQDLVERAPIMVPVNFKGYNHFVIFRGMRANRVLLADPAWGNRTMSSERFERAWITYPKIDKVGFVVLRRDGTTPPNQLVARESDFVSLR
jgi:predicted double-glycine peptidase